MICYSILINLIIILNRSFAILEIGDFVKNECSVRLETETGVETCFNQKCSDYKDPWRIINTHIQDQPCYLHYLKLAFTTYDQLMVFIELSAESNKSLEYFFDHQDTKLCMLEIEIDTIYPFNRNYFLSEKMLNKLGGKRGNIDLLLIEIKRWYKSSRSIVQMIDNDLIDKQPFQQITIHYPCNINRTIERLVLAKYLKYQEKSTCPTQINIFSQHDILTSQDESFPNQTNYKNKNNFDQPNLTNQSNFYDYKNKKSDQSNQFIKIGIIIILIIFIIGFILYYCIQSSSRSNNNNDQNQ